jgi:hypothetical protein
LQERKWKVIEIAKKKIHIMKYKKKALQTHKSQNHTVDKDTVETQDQSENAKEK